MGASAYRRTVQQTPLFQTELNTSICVGLSKSAPSLSKGLSQVVHNSFFQNFSFTSSSGPRTLVTIESLKEVCLCLQITILSPQKLSGNRAAPWHKPQGKGTLISL